MYRPTRDNPSFSSLLLDEIYRSIDDERDDKEVTNQKHTSISTNRGFQNDIREMIEKIADFNSSSSSSGSSSGGGFSSSETESVFRISSRPKPIRTSIIRNDEHMYGQKYQIEKLQTNSKHEGKFVKTKSRAMKIYGDLKKVKQPISPGGRLAAFLNSIFNTKSKSEIESSNASTCSSASSFSRSCLSNTPSSRTKLSNNKKRSVRFFPVSVIVDEDGKPCGNKSVHEQQSSHIKFVKNPTLEEKSRRIEEAARNLLRNYQKKVECEFDLSKGHNEMVMNYDHDEDDDDVSNASSDLFELENFDAIGMGKYGDELPVYETTHLDMNLAIGDGFFCNSTK